MLMHKVKKVIISLFLITILLLTSVQVKQVKAANLSFGTGLVGFLLTADAIGQAANLLTNLMVLVLAQPAQPQPLTNKKTKKIKIDNKFDNFEDFGM